MRGERFSLVFVAFRREQQSTIDSWGPWLRLPDVADKLAFYEVPVLGRRWAPMRPVIDGGMAVAVREESVRRRTVTVYGDVERIADALAIPDRSTVSVFLVDDDGYIRDRATGPFDDPIGRTGDAMIECLTRRERRPLARRGGTVPRVPAPEEPQPLRPG